MCLADRVAQAVENQPIFDLHTHLVAPCFGSLNLWGIDNILTYHYLIAEFFRHVPSQSPAEFMALPKERQAELIWNALFLQSTPVSEAQTGVITTLNALGLDARDSLDSIRAYFASLDSTEHISNVMRLSGVERVVMTNDPKDPAERAVWDSSYEEDERFLRALRLDQILATGDDEGRKDADSIRRYLSIWMTRMRPAYAAVSLPESWTYDPAGLIAQAVLPVCEEFGLPFAMMIGVRRQVNPLIGSAGDGSGWFDMVQLERLLQAHPVNRILATTLARENAHGLAVLARKFGNLTPFGCWWFMNNPSLIEEVTDLRLEMLGTTFIPQHSDARVLEHLIYKWSHSRRVIAKCLTKRYEALSISGYFVSESQINADVEALLRGNALQLTTATSV